MYTEDIRSRLVSDERRTFFCWFCSIVAILHHYLDHILHNGRLETHILLETREDELRTQKQWLSWWIDPRNGRRNDGNPYPYHRSGVGKMLLKLFHRRYASRKESVDSNGG